jgi:hypothetical protein
MTVEGLGTGKDFKLWPGGGRVWDWNETGTRHVPGIQTADVEELVANGARTIVLSRGMLLRLQVPMETLTWLTQRGVAVHVCENDTAVELYNGLRELQAVGGLFHSTC